MSSVAILPIALISCCAVLRCCAALLCSAGCAVLCCGCGVLYCRVLLLLWSDVSMMSVLTDRADDLHDHTQVVDEERLPPIRTDAHNQPPTTTTGR